MKKNYSFRFASAVALVIASGPTGLWAQTAVLSGSLGSFENPIGECAAKRPLLYGLWWPLRQPTGRSLLDRRQSSLQRAIQQRAMVRHHAGCQLQCVLLAELLHGRCRL